MIDIRSKYLKILNLDNEATVQEIKDTTKYMLKKFHPDIHEKHKKWAETQTKRILEAYKYLVKDYEKEKQRVKSIIYNPHVNIILKEEKLHYMETIYNLNNQEIKFYYNIDLIDKVVCSSQIKWIKEPHAGKFAENRYYFINSLLFANNNGIKDCKVLLFKRIKFENVNMAYAFHNGGKIIEIKKSEAEKFITKKLDKLEMLSCGDFFVINEDTFKLVEQLLIHRI